MRKFLALAALVLGVAACQTEPEDLNVTMGSEIDAVVNVTIPETETRATGGTNSGVGVFGNNVLTDDNVTMRYIFQVYYKDNGIFIASSERLVRYSDTESVSFPVRLIPERDYQFVVWADVVTKDPAATQFSDVDNHYVTTDLQNITLVNNWVAMDESRDAFTATKEIVRFNGTQAIDIDLYRPFAKLRVVTTDVVAMANLGVTPYQATVKYTTPMRDSFNALTGKVGAATRNNVEHATFVIAPYTEDKKDANGNLVERTLFTDYFFADAADIVKFQMFVEEENGEDIVTRVFNTDINVKPNFLTTLKGAILTDGSDVNVEVKPGFGGEILEQVWDGKSVSEPTNHNGTTISDATEVYISSGSELAWLAAAVNGTLTETRAAEANTFKGKTFKLYANIDLNGMEWIPIGNYDNRFLGAFDGNGYSVKNLYINLPDTNNVGFFGYTAGGDIKNLVIENAKVTGRNATAVVTGTPHTSKYSNITVKGHVELTGCGYVGVVGGYSAYGDWTDITVNVDETSFVNAHANQNNKMIRAYVGGVCGFRGEGAHTFKNVTSNINVKGATVDIGGLVGIAHYGNKFENCVCTGDVENYSESEDDAYETGGLAGVWHNETGHTVTFTNCSFTGKVKTKHDITLYNNGLVGRAYNSTGTGKLIFDNATVVTSTADFIAKAKADIEAGMTEVTYDALGVNVGSLDKANFVPAGVTVTLRNANITGVSRNNSADGTLIFDNCTFSNNSAYSINFIGGNGHVVFNKCKLVGWCTFGSVIVEMNECEITGNGKYALVRSYNTFTMNKCKIDCSNTDRTDTYHDGVSIGGGAVLTMTDCEMIVGDYEYGEAADQKTMDYSSYILVDGKRLACNVESLNAALKNGDTVLMENDITIEGYLRVSDMKDKAINIDGNNNILTTGMVYGNGCAGITLSNMTLVGSNPEYYTLYANSGKVEMTNVSINSNFNQAVCFGGGGDVILSNCSITGVANSNRYAAATIWCGDGRNMTINGGTYSSIFMNAQYHQDWIDNGWVSADNHNTTHAASKITVNDGTISKLVLETEFGAEGYYTSATLIHNGGTIETLVENPQNLDLTGRVKYEKQN